MRKSNKVPSSIKNRPYKHKSIMGSLKYAVSLPYKTNAVELVKRNR